MSFRERLAEGTPLRIGELALHLGYSREQVRKWIAANVIKTVSLPRGDGDIRGERRIASKEAEKIGKALGLL